jgi:GAF domain
MKKLNFKQRLALFSGTALLFILISTSLLIYNYLRSAEKVIHLEFAARLEQAVTALSFHALNYADGERTATVDISNDIAAFETYLNVLKVGGEVEFRADLTAVSPPEDEQSKEIISQLEAEWNGYKENLQKIASSPPAEIDENAQKYIVNNVSKIKGIIKKLSDHYYAVFQLATSGHWQYLVLFCLLLLLLILFEYHIVRTFILVPLTKIAALTENIAKGELLAIDKQTGTDEILVILNGLSEISFGLEKITTFAGSIGENNFNASLDFRSEKDQLAFALLEMRDNLLKVNEEEKKRKWINEGLAKFATILRLNVQDMQVLADTIISQLVKYISANQGGLFIHNEENGTLDLTASYAYERKRFIEKSVPVGDGLIGQAFLEKGIIYLKEIPDGYVTITSGLGEATPSQLLLIPLQVNEKAFGVIEFASFESFDTHQMEFLEKVAEDIAATIATIRMNEKTANLLRESQEQGEMLRAQEEEMRQNVEELMATQEQMKQKQIEVEISNKKLISNEQILQKAMERSRKQGDDLRIKNAEFVAQREDLQEKIKELEKTRNALDSIRDKEQKRTRLLIDQQKKLMSKVMEDFKKKEKDLITQIEQLKAGKTA